MKLPVQSQNVLGAHSCVITVEMFLMHNVSCAQNLFII